MTPLTNANTKELVASSSAAATPNTTVRPQMVSQAGNLSGHVVVSHASNVTNLQNNDRKKAMVVIIVLCVVALLIRKAQEEKELISLIDARKLSSIPVRQFCEHVYKPHEVEWRSNCDNLGEVDLACIGELHGLHLKETTSIVKLLCQDGDRVFGEFVNPDHIDGQINIKEINKKLSVSTWDSLSLKMRSMNALNLGGTLLGDIYDLFIPLLINDKKEEEFKEVENLFAEASRLCTAVKIQTPPANLKKIDNLAFRILRFSEAILEIYQKEVDTSFSSRQDHMVRKLTEDDWTRSIIGRVFGSPYRTFVIAGRDHFIEDGRIEATFSQYLNRTNRKYLVVIPKPRPKSPSVSSNPSHSSNLTVVEQQIRSVVEQKVRKIMYKCMYKILLQMDAIPSLDRLQNNSSAEALKILFQQYHIIKQLTDL